MGHAAPHVAEAPKLDIEPAQIPRQRMVGLIVMDPLRSLQAAIRDLAVSYQLHTALLLLSLPCLFIYRIYDTLIKTILDQFIISTQHSRYLCKSTGCISSKQTCIYILSITVYL